ncbi:Hypothetical predicted protein [Olea europaea subsp. europaea]|uniref:Uncharacterized protein n=1 Tax=Olea europaea subsp. europaea TaxID=158383 RepID=A0A8S0R8L7_OLEEU|nr:Hypothetical predicted protein [Olea europaea subsp. europaea]
MTYVPAEKILGLPTCGKVVGKRVETMMESFEERRAEPAPGEGARPRVLAPPESAEPSGSVTSGRRRLLEKKKTEPISIFFNREGEFVTSFSSLAAGWDWKGSSSNLLHFHFVDRFRKIAAVCRLQAETRTRSKARLLQASSTPAVLVPPATVMPRGPSHPTPTANW